MWVAALAATTGPRVMKKPIAEAVLTKAATDVPSNIESINGTCEPKVAEYPTPGITI